MEHVAGAATELQRLVENEDLPVGMAWDDLSVTVPVGPDHGIHTTGTVIVNAFKKMMGGRKKPEMKVVMEGLTGSLKPGETLLVIGPPGSGCESPTRVPLDRMKRAQRRGTVHGIVCVRACVCAC